MPRTTPPAIPPGSMADRVQPTITIDDELQLRPWRMTDAPAVLAAFQDPDIVQWHARRMQTDEQAEDWIRDVQTAWTSETSAGWAIVDVANDAVLGRCALHTQPAGGIAEVAYWLLPGGRGRGAATRAAIAATTWAHDFGFDRVELEHSTRNLASRAVAERAGFIPEGIKRQSARHADGLHDMQLYAHIIGDPFPETVDSYP